MSDVQAKLREIIETRFSTDYTAAGGTFRVQYPNRDIDNKVTGYIALSWLSGGSLGASFFQRAERVPTVLNAQVFVKKGTGTVTARAECDKISDIWRGQTYKLIENTPSGVVPSRPVDGTNQVNSVITANLRIQDPTTTDVGLDDAKTWYQINVQCDAILAVKYGLVV